MRYNISSYFEETVEKFPNKIAIIDGDKEINFKDLEQNSKKLAYRIIKSEIINSPIAVYLPKSIESIYSNIGITYSGNTYMNLDIKSPVERVKNIFARIQPRVVISNSALIKKINDVLPEGILIINLDDFNFDEGYDQKVISERLYRIIDADPLCIINTSGSTGTPKGVVLNHKSFIDFTEWSLSAFEFSDNEIIGSLSPLVFDIYSFELCLLMAKGATMVLIPDSLAAFPVKILELMQLHKVSFIFWVPTIMVNIANMDLLRTDYLKDLRLVWFAGEVFPTQQFNYWRKNLPKVLFANLYGPIEITLDCTYYIVEREIEDNEPIPIGYACKNTDILILNDQDKLVNGNEEGELCVRGTSLAMGYYNNPEKTAQAFVQNPLNNSYPEIMYRTGDIVSVNERGEIVFKGRKDSLIKHLGYRIELGEIEHVVVNTLKIVKNACVVYNFPLKEITLIYEADSEMPVKEFRNLISKKLPKYMVPTVFKQKAILPRNTNGKIDRLALSNEVNCI
ncbi:amino acid adenylation domain-containing protein [Marinifilum fragile]|uniref:amino acid adenylation domain-containing protein n=1 Tax=Marinifilum fragile TaxID=570161 RepID=UPI0006D102DA|nr:amino acid adenylation domain-containing protein [Marinifilum fragile]